jgi:hypothetical protein
LAAARAELSCAEQETARRRIVISAPSEQRHRAFSAGLLNLFPINHFSGEALMRQNQMMSNGRAFGLTMGDWFTLLAGCFAVIALAALLV